MNKDLIKNKLNFGKEILNNISKMRNKEIKSSKIQIWDTKKFYYSKSIKRIKIIEKLKKWIQMNCYSIKIKLNN